MDISGNLADERTFIHHHSSFTHLRDIEISTLSHVHCLRLHVRLHLGRHLPVSCIYIEMLEEGILSTSIVNFSLGKDASLSKQG